MNLKTHLPPVTDHLIEPLYGLFGAIATALQLGGSKLSGIEGAQVLAVACATNRSVHNIMTGLANDEGQKIAPDTLNKQLKGLRRMSLDELHPTLQPILDNQTELAIRDYRQRWHTKMPELVAAFDFHEIDVNVSENSPLMPYVTPRPKYDKFSKAKGKRYVLRFLTCSIVHPFIHVTAVRLIPRVNKDDSWSVVTQIVSHLRQFGIKRYLMDREFFVVELVHWFETAPEAKGIEYLMPAPRTDGIKQAEIPVEEKMLSFEGRYRDFHLREEYTMTSGTAKRTETHLNWVPRIAFLDHLKKQHFGPEYLTKLNHYYKDSKVIAFATNITQPLTYKLLGEVYKKRWGIENGYRTAESLMPRTASRSGNMRVFMFTLACMLENIWERERFFVQMTCDDFKDATVAVVEMSEREVGRKREAASNRTPFNINEFANRMQQKLPRSRSNRRPGLQSGEENQGRVHRDRIRRAEGEPDGAVNLCS